MKRIKSAPANICMMCHNKLTKSKKIVSTLLNTNNSDNIEEIKKKENIKKQKSILNTSSNIIGDAISDSNSLSLQENYFIILIVSFISENIIKKNNLENFQAFILQNLVRFMISYIIHNYAIVDILQITNLH